MRVRVESKTREARKVISKSRAARLGAGRLDAIRLYPAARLQHLSHFHNESMCTAQRISIRSNWLGSLLSQNRVAGCIVITNKFIVSVTLGSPSSRSPTPSLQVVHTRRMPQCPHPPLPKSSPNVTNHSQRGCRLLAPNVRSPNERTLLLPSRGARAVE